MLCFRNKDLFTSLFVCGFFVGLVARQPSAQATPLNIGVIGDLNGTECQSEYPRNSVVAFDNMLKLFKPDHIILPGDLVHGECLSYRGAKPYADVVRSMWTSFENNFFAKVPSDRSLTAAPGNHDAPWVTSSSRATFKAENEGFRTFWQSKESALGVHRIKLRDTSDNYPFYWAYVLDDVLFVTLHSVTTGSLSDGAKQKAWLKALLASPEALGAKTRIAYGHVPPYPVLDPSVGSKYSAVLRSEQSGKAGSLVDLLIDGNINLLVVGHSHAPFPGELTRQLDKKTLKILSLPCAHSPRKLYSKTTVAPRGFSMVRVDDSGEISVGVHRWDTGELVPFEYFPELIKISDSKVRYQRVNQANYH